MAAPTPTPPLLQEAFLAVLAAAVSLALLALLPLAALALWDIRRHPLRAAAPVALAAVALQLFFVRAPAALEWRINHARAPLPARYAAYAAAAPPTFRAADLHCDALLWRRRDLLARGTAGHVDVPRLVEGAFAIQVFALVVSVPRGLNVVANAPPSSPLADHIFAKAVLERWPLRAWASQLQRALVQCARLHQVAAASGGRLVVARTAADLRRPPAGTDAGGTAGGAVRGVLALEGAGALEGRLENVDVLFDAGLRVLGPTHFFDTEVGGSLSGVGKGGLSTFGRRVVARMKELHMTVDVAHASHAVIEDLAAMPQEGRPCVFLSHTGIRSVCESQRNVDDEHLRLVYVSAFQCGSRASAAARRPLLYCVALTWPRRSALLCAANVMPGLRWAASWASRSSARLCATRRTCSGALSSLSRARSPSSASTVWRSGRTLTGPSSRRSTPARAAQSLAPSSTRAA
jgi:membrane dipeptidase